uniref:Myozenin 3 n=1 Tax=Pelusios castaneus TaxID=367368 RepID=A0A8C8ST80_9SAUR
GHLCEEKGSPRVVVRMGRTPQLDLGKKVSTPQDLMVEELSLQTNRGSRLFQQRQRRVQKFVLEHPAGYRTVSRLSTVGTQSRWLSRTGARLADRPGAAAEAMSRALNPGALAPGYSGPLQEVPPEKFNYTSIPKGYHSPWQEFLSSEDYQTDSKSNVSELPRKPNHFELRSFNRTPTPFGGLLLADMFPAPGLEMEVQPDFELVWNRPSFNRAPQGWVQILPETEEL